MNDNNVKNSQGVDSILGNPKTALWKMSIPLIISLLITSLYSVIDAVWVSGLGADALAGVGFPLQHYQNISVKTIRESLIMELFIQFL